MLMSAVPAFGRWQPEYTDPVAENLLYYGDNLNILVAISKQSPSTSSLLTPPFKSNQDYNVLFAEQDGSRAAAQIKAFEDTWRWDQAAAGAYHEIVDAGGKISQAMQAFRLLLGDSDMLAYLAMMAGRIVELERVLKTGGSIYLHCDPTASHYLKLLLDSVFGSRSFQNEIIWSYRRWPAPVKHFQRMHDSLLFYAKGGVPATFNVEYEENSPSYLRRFKGNTQMLDPETKTRKITLDQPSRGLPRRDVWELSIIAGSKKERLGYPTQKPESLLERIVRASSDEGQIILDPFCGCGTTVAVAQGLNRRWIGIDVTYLAIGLIKNRLRDAFGDKAVYQVIGEPISIPDAEALAGQDPFQFQWWALGLVGAQPAEQKKGADRGIDGRLYFHEQGAELSQRGQIILSVKAGHATVAHVRDLRGVIEREGAAIGVLISMQEPTQPMKTEAAGAGFYTNPWSGERYSRLQVLSVADLLADKSIAYPRYRENITFRRAPKATKPQAGTAQLPLEVWFGPRLG